MNFLRPVRSIRFKIGLVIGFTFFLGFAGAAGYLFYRVRQILIQQDNRTLMDRAIRLAERTSVYPLVVPLPEQGEVVALWYRHGKYQKQLFRSAAFPSLKKVPLPSSGVVDVDTFRLASYVHTSEDGYGQLSVVLGRSSRPLVHELQQIGWLLALTIVLSLLVSGVGAWWLGGWLLRPLQAIIISAQSVNRAEQATPIPTPTTGDELQVLAETINEMLARIRKSVDTQHNFFAAASHELRTPLSILRTQVEVAHHEADTEHERQFLTSQLVELRRLSRLVDDLLSMSQLRAGTLQLRFEPIELDELTLRLAERYQRAINERNLYLAIQLDETVDSLSVWADEDKLTNVLLNLLDNAVKYAVADTQLTLTIMYQNEVVVWSLQNQTTAPLANLTHLTREFYQADPRHDGYGLGLWISHQMVRLMNGMLTLQAVDGQFRAEVRLPCSSFSEPSMPVH